jgi:hypothetical protein
MSRKAIDVIFDEHAIFAIADPQLLELVAGRAGEVTESADNSCCNNFGCCNSNCPENTYCVVIEQVGIGFGVPQVVCPPRPQVMCGPLCSC